MAATRRQVLKWIGYGVGAAALPLALPGSARAQVAPRKLVVLALRGGVDGLHLVPPVGPGVSSNFRLGYMSERPTIHFDPSANPPPERTTLPIAGNGYFHLHPQLGFFADVFATSPDGLKMAIVHGVGGTGSRSHFSSLDAWEWARPYGSGVGSFNGWLNDALTRLYPDTSADLSPLNGVAIQGNLPKSLDFVGNALRRATPVPDIDGVTLRDPGRRSLLDQLYAGDGRSPAVTAAAANALHVVDTLATLPPSPSTGPGSFDVLYPSGSRSLNRGFHSIARLIDDGPASSNVFTLDYNAGWDTHADQVSELDLDGARRVEGLSLGLQHFYGELAYRTIDPNDVCTVVFTDFGRTADENSDGGTDHGNGGTMFVLGGGLPTSRVIHTGWDFTDFGANLERTNGTAPVLDGVGGARTELRTLVDFRSVYRDVLANVFGMGQADFDAVFNDPSVTSAGVWS